MNKKGGEFGAFIIFAIIFIIILNLNFICAQDIKINSLNYTSVFAESQTQLQVNAEINETINATYYWQLGDGINITTDSGILNHTYEKEGNYSIIINISDIYNQGVSGFKIFKIRIYQSKYSINLSIDSKLQDIINVKSQIDENFSSFRQEAINDAVNFDDLETQLNNARDDFNSAVSDSDYIKVISRLNSIKTPKLIFISESIDYSVFYPSESAINFDAVTGITGESYDREIIDRYIGALNAWSMENLDTKLRYERVSLKYQDSTKFLANFFDVNIAEKNPASYYIIIKDMQDLTFDRDYSEKKQGNYIYITGAKKISFSTTEDVDFTNIPMFISPRIESLDVQANVGLCNKNNKCESERGETWQNCSDCSRATIILPAILGLIVFGVIIYFLLRWWYGSKYESSLFKNKTDLYNLLAYMNSTKKKGYNDKDVRSRLKKAGWTGEQITYAIKKYGGKNTGLP